MAGENPPMSRWGSFIGKAALLGALSFAGETVAQETKEDPVVAGMRVQIRKLIPDLDSDTPATRLKASGELKSMVTKWVREKKSPFPALQELSIERENQESRRRLQLILHAHDQELHALALLPTLVTLERKSWPIQALARELEQKTGEKIDFANPVEGAVHIGGQLPFWHFMEAIRQKAGPTFGFTRPVSDTITLGDPSKHELYAYNKPLEMWTRNKGPFLAQLTRYPHLCCEEEDTQRPDTLVVNILSEKRLMMSGVRITQAQCQTDDGKELPLNNDDSSIFIPHRSLRITVPPDTQAKAFTLKVQVDFHAFGQKKVRVPHAAKDHLLHTNSDGMEIVYKGISRESAGTFSVNALGNRPGSLDTVYQPLRCHALDAKGNPLPVQSLTSQNSGDSTLISWNFAVEPRQLEFSVPERHFHQLETFVFEDIPVKKPSKK